MTTTEKTNLCPVWNRGISLREDIKCPFGEKENCTLFYDKEDGYCKIPRLTLAREVSSNE